MPADSVRARVFRATIAVSAVLLSLQHAVAAAELGRNQDGPLEATLTEKLLQVHGTTPGGEVAYLGANHEEHQESWGSLRTYSGTLVDEDFDGEVDFAPEAGISTASVWLIVDVASGNVVSVTPEAMAARLPREADVGVVSNGRMITADRQDLEFLLYRPGVGVWFGKGLDGGQGDDSLHADERLRVDLRAFRSLRSGGPAAPSTLQPGDRLLAVDLNHLDAVRVDFQ